jgi:hypothetical protein
MSTVMFRVKLFETLLHQKRGEDDWDTESVVSGRGFVTDWWFVGVGCEWVWYGCGVLAEPFGDRAGDGCGTVRYLSTLSHGKVLLHM